ncbi:protein translocase subunit SecD [Paludibaculum fermentans]|uniref:Protein translocase subunit SecD n=1 Tax=Paludibaculum fermentans TaxID=1473598 RepID=A0A7S7NRT7_PALFE|nr:protein translocase subunit SecD [Paludibaculum fermentans]QOY88064.1 protein translocase subunit SecD [Paludibaculum fermentans]
MQNLKWKAVLIVAVVLICVYGMIGIPKSKDELIANWHNNIRLGLDLKGGTLLVLQVQVQDAFKAEAIQQIERLKEELGKQSINYGSMDHSEPKTIAEADKIQIDIKGIPSDKTAAFRTLISESMPSWVLTPVNSTDYRVNMKPTEALALTKDTLARSRTTIESRINGLGLAESSVQERGGANADGEILVSLPGLDDPARVKAILQTAAMLELYEVKDGPFPRQQDALAKTGGVLPLNTKLLRSQPRAGDQNNEGWYIVTRTPVITGRDLRDAKPAQDEFGKWETSFVLAQDAKGRFGKFTESNVGQRLAIVLDSQIRSAPVIQSRIEDSGRITGAGSQQDASDLALVLRAGSLPAGVIYLQEQTVGPSLGADSIQQGLISGLVGLIAVIVIMLIYYHMSGVNATIALILNAIILIGALAYLKAVLTLPGIAGVILLIGMAVDSNVLIFERIREEMRTGKAVLAAIDTGFSKAFLTIIDTHVATVVSCAFLFMFGTPAVRGFAVTLVIGLLANVFTSVFVSRALFQMEMAGKGPNATLSIGV